MRDFYVFEGEFMATYSSNKDFNAYIRKLLVSDDWVFKTNGNSKHAYLLFKPSGKKVPIPSSPKGDGPGFENFKCLIRRVIREFQSMNQTQNQNPQSHS